MFISMTFSRICSLVSALPTPATCYLLRDSYFRTSAPRLLHHDNVYLLYRFLTGRLLNIQTLTDYYCSLVTFWLCVYQHANKLIIHHVAVRLSPQGRGPLGRVPSLFQPQPLQYTRHAIPFLDWVRTPSFVLSRRRHDEGTELPERRLAVVDVPLTHDKPVSPAFSISNV
jgi:hypothetical protein